MNNSKILAAVVSLSISVGSVSAQTELAPVYAPNQSQSRGPAAPAAPKTPFDECMSNVGSTVVTGAIAGLLGGLLRGATQKNGDVGGSAVAGALIGVVGGFAVAWGKCYSQTSKIKSEQVTGYSSAANQLGYKPSQGAALEIRNAYLDAAAVAPGGIMSVVVPYYLLLPDGAKEIEVTERQALFAKDKKTNKYEKVGETSEKLVAKQGMRKGGAPLELPKDADTGQFAISYTVEAMGKTEVKTLEFVVTKDQQSLANAQELAKGERSKFAQMGGDSQQLALVATADVGKSIGEKSVQPEPDKIGEKSVQPGAGKSSAQVALKRLVVLVNTTSLRKDPDSGANVVSTLKKGEKYPYQESVSIGGKKWFLMTTDEGNKGWVLGAAVKQDP